MQKESSQEESSEDNLTSTTIDRLQEYGINAADINKLKSAGICTAKGLLMVTRKELLNIKGISDVKIDKMVEAAPAALTAFSSTLALSFTSKRRRVAQ